MFDYLQQFNRLPKDLRDKVSSPLVMAAISELEKKYKADLAAIVMKVMIKGVPIKELALYLASESGLSPEKSEELAGEMRTKVFSSAADYLGLTTMQRALDLNKDIEVIIKEAGLVLPSSVLVNRFKTILSTFLKGVRSKIDTRNSLMKDTKIGGLKLSSDEVDRIFKICASYKFSNLITDLPDHHKDADDRSQQKVAEPPVKEVEAQKQQPDTSSAPSAMQKISPRLAEIIAQADQEGGYDLKKSIAVNNSKAQLVTDKTKNQLDTTHEISAPKPQLDLPLPNKTPQIAAVPIPKKMPSGISKSVEVGSKSFFSKIEERFKKLVGDTSTPSVKVLAPKKVAPVTPVAPVISKLEELKKPVVTPVVKPIPLKPSVLKPPVAPIKKDDKKIVPSQVIAKKVSPPVSTAASRPAPAVSPRPQMHDIRPMPKVMGPIEELQFLDVVNFRRLGITPAESVKKIYSKIKLLEKDGYDKMVAGVKAWRQSPTNRLYIRLGQESVTKGQPFNDILAERKKSGQDFLSLEEVQAIIALNGKLVF